MNLLRYQKYININGLWSVSFAGHLAGVNIALVSWLTGGVDGAAAGDAVVVTVVLLAVVAAVAESTHTGIQHGQESATV